MPRIKTNKEYAIRLVHKDLGTFYFNYINDNPWYNGSTLKYVFTKDLNKVKTWKTLSFAERYIDDISTKLKTSKSYIILPYGTEFPDVPDKYKDSIKLYRTKYEYRIDKIVSRIHIQKSEEIISELDKSLLTDSKHIFKTIKKLLFMEDGFEKIVSKLAKDVKEYKKNHKFLHSVKDCDDVYLDIVDASFNFRTLKLRNLKVLDQESEQ